MRIISIATGLPQEIHFDGRTFLTSIFKKPVAGPICARLTNLDGDRQADLTVHGGRNKAVYAYSEDYYRSWANELGRTDLETAQFGENLTISGGRDSEVVIGSRLAAGQAEFTVTQPRIPCYKLGARLDDKTFPARFWKAGRLGFYLRVEVEGDIRAGDALKTLSLPQHGIRVRDLYDIVNRDDAAKATYALEMLPHIDEGWLRRLRAVIHRDNRN